MNTVSFVTPGKIELAAILTMGVSVKSDSAIGYFGTGFKYALATILRNGGSLTLVTEGTEYLFSTQEKNIRGKLFDIICCNDQELQITTDLGRNWTLEQAYRELHSNTLDEHGIVVPGIPQLGDDQSMITVTSDGFYNCYKNRDKQFLNSSKYKLIFSSDSIDVYDRVTPNFFYRGVRVFEAPKPFRYLYNYKAKSTLTEDRTMGYYTVLHIISEFLRREAPTEIISPALNKRYIDSDCIVEYDYFSDDFKTALKGYFSCLDAVSERLRTACYTSVEVEHEDVALSPHQQDIVNQVLGLFSSCGITIPSLTFTYDTPDNANGFANLRTGRIYINPRVISDDTGELIKTIFEEYVHVKHDVRDYTRGMQNALIDEFYLLLLRKGK